MLPVRRSGRGGSAVAHPCSKMPTRPCRTSEPPASARLCIHAIMESPVLSNMSTDVHSESTAGTRTCPEGEGHACSALVHSSKLLRMDFLLDSSSVVAHALNIKQPCTAPCAGRPQISGSNPVHQSIFQSKNSRMLL